jgi:HlyD family secretion protein
MLGSLPLAIPRLLPRPSSPLVILALLAAVAVIVLETGTLAAMRQIIPGLGSPAPSFRTATAHHADLIDGVTATGPITAARDLPLTFKSSGNLSRIDVKVGDHVRQGQTLASLESNDLQTSLDQAQATLAKDRAALAKLEAGATDSQKEVAQTTIDNARKSAASAAASAAASDASAGQNVRAADDAVRTAQTNLTTAQDSLATTQDQAAKGIAADQTAIDNAQKNLTAIQAQVAANQPVLVQAVEQAKDQLYAQQVSRDAACGRDQGAGCKSADASVAAAETAVSSAQASLTEGLKTGQQQIAAAQASLNSARAQLASDQAKNQASIVSARDQVKQDQAALTTARTGVAQARANGTTTAESNQAQVVSASNTLSAAQANYDQTVAPAAPSDVDAAKAQIAIDEAAVAAARGNLVAATLVAPFDGTVAAINGSLGQWVSGGPATGTGFLELVTLDDVQVTAQVNEADVARVKVGTPVTFGVSAFPDRTFHGQVTTLQPVGSTGQNVVNYTLTAAIQSTGEAMLLPGMTATLTVVAAEHPNALVVPSAALSFPLTAARQGLLGAPAAPAGGSRRAVGASSAGPSQAKDSGTTVVVGGPTGEAPANVSAASGSSGLVLTLVGSKSVPVPVTVGISDGTNTEILGGLREGQTVVVGALGGNGASPTAASRPAGPAPAGEAVNVAKGR